MQYGCGAEAAAVTAKIANLENMNVWFHWCGAVVERLVAVLWIFLCVLHGAIPAAIAWPLQWKVGVVCIPANVFRKLNSYQSFQDAGNRDVSRLLKTELKL